MMERQSLALSGELGSGKSTVAKLLAAELGFAVISLGVVQRQLAASMGMTTLELNRHMEGRPEMDRLLDARFVATPGLAFNHIIDARLGWHFVPAAFRVHLIIAPAKAAARVLADGGRSGERYAGLVEAEAALAARTASERQRFLDCYGLDCSELRNYQLVVDSSSATPAEVVVAILAAYQAPGAARLFLDPRRIMPTQGGREPAGGTPLSEAPVTVVQVDGRFYLVDGHRRVSAALLAHQPLVAADLLARDDEPLPSGLSARRFAARETGPS